MKRYTIALVGLFLFTATSFADTKLPKDATGLSNVTRIVLSRVVTPPVPPHRPGGPIYEVMSTAVLTATLVGCVDQLGPVASYLEREPGGKTVIYVSAVNIATKRSEDTKCFAAPMAEFEVGFGMGFYDPHSIEVKVLR